MTAHGAQSGAEEQGCPVCGRPAPAPFVTIGNVTVQVNTLHRSAEAARAVPRSDLELAFCDGCAFIWNVAFDATLVEYDGEYENALHHSPAFEAYATALAERLVERYDLRARHVVEIGCGQGTFLRRLCEVGGNRGTGFDPAYVGPERDGPVTIHRAMYSEETIGDTAPDFLCVQHVLEHVQEPREFLRSLRRTLGRGTMLYLEVPNGASQLDKGVVWDMIYAHPSTFTRPSLCRLVERSGFEVLDCGTAFGEQYLWIEARPVDTAPVRDLAEEVVRMRELADRFAKGYHEAVRAWRRRIDGFAARGLSVYLWGAGAKGVTLLNSLDAPAAVGGVVDVNPRKHGSYLPGSGSRVVAPESLPGHEPDVVVLANPIYRDEVVATLARLGQHADVICV